MLYVLVCTKSIEYLNLYIDETLKPDLAIHLHTLDTLYQFLFECKKMQNIFAALNMGHFPQ